jgi:single-stranded-DNA-specific exonuclease
MHRRWLVNRTNPAFIQHLSITASVSPLLAQILINRGIKTAGDICSYLNHGLADLSDPFAIQGMKKAVVRIMEASRSGEKILVHGDYDADGLTATAVLLKTLKLAGIETCYFIPNRMEHGYGFHPASIKKAKLSGASLIITVDCGITSFETAEICRREGIDLIITDHHEPAAAQETQKPGDRETEGNEASHHFFRLPDALAVINPKLSAADCRLSILSGAGIALKLSHAIFMSAYNNDSHSMMRDLLDLAALGTTADVVPLTGENRIIVREGLALIGNGICPGIQSLKRVAGIDGKRLSTGLLSFSLIPRINAAGRMADANDVVKLFLTDSVEEADRLSLWLDTLNSRRQQIEEEAYQEALSMLGVKGTSPAIVLASEKWHKGVVGIVASRLAEAFYRPAFIFSIEDGIARGSARSIPPFNLYNALIGCKEFLRKFGGHKLAAGLELEVRNLSSFGKCMNSLAEESLSEADLVPSLEIDADINFSDIGFHLTEEFTKLEPFGYGNPEPILASKNLEVLFPKILKDAHLKMKLRKKSRSLDAIGFNMAPFIDRLGPAGTVDAVFTLCVNEWEGKSSLQLNLKALRPSQ